MPKVKGLSDKELTEIRDSLGKLQSTFHPHRLNELEGEWQSRETQSSKKIFATLAFAFSTAIGSSIDFGSIPFLGLSAGTGDPKAFTGILAAIMIGFSVIYLINWLRDYSHRRIKSMYIARSTRDGIKAFRYIRRKAGVKPWSRLPSDLDFEGLAAKFPSQNHYMERDKLRQTEDYVRSAYWPSRLGDWIAILEPIVLFGLLAYSMWGLAGFWMSEVAASPSSESLILF